MALTDSELKALELIRSNPKHLCERGHQLINNNIKPLLKKSFVRYAPRKSVGYEPTLRGLHVAP